MSCVACLLDRKWECAYRGNCDPNSSSDSPDDTNSVSNGEDTSESTDGNSENSDEVVEPTFKTYKSDNALRDQQSTGRKRAAKMYPLDPEGDCEWKMHSNCGGGVNPIVGCLEGKQTDRHHGPDKNTLNNEKGNVHRICSNCHNRWHARNNPGYVVTTAVKNQHSPVAETKANILLAEASWVGKVIKKVKD